MNPDQKANVDATARAIGQSLAAAWSYFHLLRGLDVGRMGHPQVVQRFDLLYDRTWRAVFDGLFAKVGTVLDATRATHSLPNLITLIRKSGDVELKQHLPEVERKMASKGSSLAKLKNWRHDAVAHRPTARNDLDFYADNRMTLSEIELALSDLDELFNYLSWNVLGIDNDTRSGTASLVDDAKALFECSAIGLRAKPE